MNFSSSDFPQADRIWKIHDLVRAVYRGSQTEAELEVALSMSSKGRQARYYRLAAVTFGLVEFRDGEVTLTPRGIQLAESSGPAAEDLVRAAVFDHKVCNAALNYVSSDNRTLRELKSKIVSMYPGAPGTGERRSISIINYLEETDLISISQLGVVSATSFYEALVESQLNLGGGTLGNKLTDPRNLGEKFKKRTVGFISDAKLRKAIEVQAVLQATRHYEQDGYSVEDVGATHSFDLLVSKGGEVRHVEVKGSQAPIVNCVLTKNEVEHAKAYQATDLVLVSNIRSQFDSGTQSWKTFDGDVRVISDWQPEAGALTPLSYSYDITFTG